MTGLGSGSGASSAAPAPAPVRVLVVCTGNLCRSPLFAALLARDVDPARVDVTSRGTQAALGAPVPAATRAAGRRLGIDLEGHVPRAVAVADLDAAHLVLTATRRHRRDLARTSPAVASRAFTIAEFARLAEAALADSTPGISVDTPERGVSRRAGADASPLTLEALLRMRGSVLRPDDAGDDDVPDPMGRRAGVHHRVARRLASAAEDVAAVLGLVAVDPGADRRLPGGSSRSGAGSSGVEVASVVPGTTEAGAAPPSEAAWASRREARAAAAAGDRRAPLPRRSASPVAGSLVTPPSGGRDAGPGSSAPGRRARRGETGSRGFATA